MLQYARSVGELYKSGCWVSNVKIIISLSFDIRISKCVSPALPPLLYHIQYVLLQDLINGEIEINWFFRFAYNNFMSAW